MAGTVEVSIPVEAEAAAALSNEHTRAAVGRIVSRMVRPGTGPDPLAELMDRIGAEAERRGLTDDILERELAAYNSERQQGVNRIR